MTSFFAEKQTRMTEDEGRRTEYQQLGAGEVLDEFVQLPDEDGELSLKLLGVAPNVELNLVSGCLLPLRIVWKISNAALRKSGGRRAFQFIAIASIKPLPDAAPAASRGTPIGEKLRT